MTKSSFSFILLLAFLCVQMHTSDLHAKTVELIVQGANCDQINEMYIFEFDGLGFEQVQSTTKNEAGEFVFKVKTDGMQFRYVGLEVGKFKSIVLGAEEKVVIKGDCRSFNKANAPEGLNLEYNTMMSKIRLNSNKEKNIGTRFAKSFRDPSKQAALTKEFASLDQAKKELIETYAAKNDWLGEVAKLYTYYSYQNSGTDFPNEVVYFGNEYFAQADLKSKAYGNMPLLFDVFSKFSTTLSKVQGLPVAELENFLNLNLDKLTENSDAQKMALGGILSGLRSAQSPLFIPYATRYLDQFCVDNSKGCQNLKSQIKNAESFIVGAVAPDFTMKNLDGEAVNLSDFRGKVVLIDFWASWCGPCRKDNPHVVELYKKYKKDGFEILGVSLDKTKDKWEQAISKDNLTWTHVSDLKGWKNEVAQMYSVKSIPHTVLLDEEGKIIARKLRGPQLDQKLAAIFGH